MFLRFRSTDVMLVCVPHCNLLSFEANISSAVWMADSAVPCCEGAVVLEPGADLRNLPQIITTPEPVRTKAETDLPIRWPADRLQLPSKPSTLEVLAEFFSGLLALSVLQLASCPMKGRSHWGPIRETCWQRTRSKNQTEAASVDLAAVSLASILVWSAGGAPCQRPV